MNINAVNLNASTGISGSSAAYRSGVKFIPSNGDTSSKAAAANGGVSKDGDTVAVSSEGSSLQKMYDSGSQNTSVFLDDARETSSTAEVISSSAQDIGISRETNEMQNERAMINIVVSSVSEASEAVSSSASSVDTNNLSRYSDYELRELYEDGDITPAEYRSEIQRRETNGINNRNNDNEKEDFTIELNKDRAEKARFEKAEEEKQRLEKQQADKRLDDADTDKAQEKRAEATDNRLDAQRENLQAAREADKDLYNVAFSFEDDPYDVTSSIEEMEEDESAVGVNRIVIPEESLRENITIRISAPETAEEADELEDIPSMVNSENVTAADNGQQIEAAGNTAAQNTIDQNAINNRLTVQEV